MTTIQQLRANLERALDAIGPALSCWADYMPVGDDGVRLTRLGLEQSHKDLQDALKQLGALEADIKDRWQDLYDRCEASAQQPKDYNDLWDQQLERDAASGAIDRLIADVEQSSLRPKP